MTRKKLANAKTSSIDASRTNCMEPMQHRLCGGFSCTCGAWLKLWHVCTLAACGGGMAAGACGPVPGHPWARVGRRAGGCSHADSLQASATWHKGSHRAPWWPPLVAAVEAAALPVCGASQDRPPGAQRPSVIPALLLQSRTFQI